MLGDNIEKGISRFISNNQLEAFTNLGVAFHPQTEGVTALGPARLIKAIPAGTIVGVVIHEHEEDKVFPLAIIPVEDLTSVIELTQEDGSAASMVMSNGVQVDVTTAFGDDVIAEAERIINEDE